MLKFNIIFLSLYTFFFFFNMSFIYSVAIEFFPSLIYQYLQDP